MVFGFFKKKTSHTLIETDIHSHLIPSIDDGVESMEDAIRLIKELQSMGYKKLITTPHISDMFPNTTEIILDGYHALKEEMVHQNIEIEIEVAAEYYANEHFENLLQKRDILTFGKEKYLLFELSYFTPPHNLDDLIYEIKLQGYTPVLAHPERYLYWHDDFNYYKEIKAMGVHLQLNLNSINGYYNHDIQHIAEQLIKHSMVDFIGSDAHHMTHIKGIKMSLAHATYKKIFKHNIILNDTLR